MSRVIGRSPFVLHPRTWQWIGVGRSPGSRVAARLGLPGASRLQWHVEEGSPLTVAGAAAASGSPSPRSLLLPAGRGNRPADYNERRQGRKADRQHRIDAILSLARRTALRYARLSR